MNPAIPSPSPVIFKDSHSDGAERLSRLHRWITLCDELSCALLATSRNLLANAGNAEERLDYLKELVTVGHRLFALERSLADTSELAGDASRGTDGEALHPHLGRLLELVQKLDCVPQGASDAHQNHEGDEEVPRQPWSEPRDTCDRVGDTSDEI